LGGYARKTLMKKRSYLILLLFMVCCIGWFALASIRENLAPVPGWIQFGNTGAEEPIFRFWLPKYYEGVNPSVLALMMKNTADDFGSQYSILLDEVNIVFSARDTRADDAQPDVFVSYSFLAPGSKIPELALEEIRSRIDNQPNVKLIDSRITSLNNYQTIFLAYDISFEELEVRQVQYLIFDGDITWIVIYLPNKDKYEEELSIFEQSIRTFKISH
jgi:hypothetical protein